jgi:hypothetical protein
VTAAWRVGSRDRGARTRRPQIPGATAPVGGGTEFCLVEPQPPAGQGLRAPCPNQRDLDRSRGNALGAPSARLSPHTTRPACYELRCIITTWGLPTKRRCLCGRPSISLAALSGSLTVDPVPLGYFASERVKGAAVATATLPPVYIQYTSPHRSDSRTCAGSSAGLVRAQGRYADAWAVGPRHLLNTTLNMPQPVLQRALIQSDDTQ